MPNRYGIGSGGFPPFFLKFATGILFCRGSWGGKRIWALMTRSWWNRSHSVRGLCKMGSVPAPGSMYGGRLTLALTLLPPRILAFFSSSPFCPLGCPSKASFSSPPPVSFSLSALLSLCPPTRWFLSWIFFFLSSLDPPPPAVSSTLIVRPLSSEWWSLRQAWRTVEEGSSRKAMPLDLAAWVGVAFVVRSRTDGNWPKVSN